MWMLIILCLAMDSPSESAAKRLAWDVESRRSIELRVTHKIIAANPDPQVPPDFDSIDEHYIETATGQRLYESRYLKAGKAVNRRVRYSDGTRCADVDYKQGNLDEQQNVIIKRSFGIETNTDFMDIPSPYKFFFVGKVPLHEALSEAAYVGSDKLLGRDCDIFSFPNVGKASPQTKIYFLDKLTSVPLKVEYHRVGEDRIGENLLMVWTADTINSAHGHLVAFRSTSIDYTGKNSEVLFTRHFDVQLIDFDKDYPDSMFWPTLQPGVQVLDSITGKSYVTPGKKSNPTEANQEPASDVQPIRATPPGGWMTVIPNMALGLGIAILVVGCILWLRRR